MGDRVKSILSFQPAAKLWAQWFKHAAWTEGTSCNTVPISIIGQVVEITSGDISLLPDHSGDPMLFFIMARFLTQRCMCAPKVLVLAIDLLKTVILDASPANKPYLRKQKPVYAYALFFQTCTSFCLISGC